MSIDMGLPTLFFIIAIFYAMVGFGGGSSYLAILVLFGLPYAQIPATALICNLIVTAGGFIHFYRAGYFKLQNVLPFIVLSIPMAYFGGSILIGKELFSLLLGVSLLAVAFRMFLPAKKFTTIRTVTWPQAWLMGLPIGLLLGFLAGLVGIGGGIFLSPILLLMRWANIKEAAASASLFILVNSFSGLLGQLQKGLADFSFLLPLGIVVFIGGQLGSMLGSYRIPKLGLQKIMAVLVLYVSVKLLGAAL